MASEQFSLCWDNFHKNMSSGMNSLLENEDLVDVTLAVEGKHLKAHKMVLSVCSPYFKELFKSNPCKHPIVFMKDVSYVALSDLLQFMYQGEVQVSHENLPTFIKTAEALQIKGLTADGTNSTESDVDQEGSSVQHILEDTKSEYKSNPPVTRPKKNPPQPLPTPPAKRHRSNTSSSEVGSSSNIITKTEPVSNPPATEFVQFKMEPYDQSQTISIQDDDEQFGEGLDETVGDETEDYSMMESNEEEPQAGTSTEGTGEGQVHHETDYRWINANATMNIRTNVDPLAVGFQVNSKEFAVPSTPSANISRYLRCLEYKRLGCHARAVLPYDGSIDDIKINKPHNHPPDYSAEEKIVFMRELKEVMLKNPSVPSRTVYATLSAIYPNAARETPFDHIRHKMNRWRRMTDDQWPMKS